MAYAAIIGAVTAAVGAGVSAYSASSQARYGAAVARNSQTIAEQNADLAAKKGALEEQAQREKTAQTASLARAGAAASGVDPTAIGSPLRIQGDIAKLGELDALTIRNNAEREAAGYRSQGASFVAQGDLGQAAGNLDTFSSIMGGASSVADKWAAYRTAGVRGFA